MSEYVTEKVEAGVQYICLNRTEKKNAITLEMYQALTEALRSAEQNSEVKVSMIFGAGEDFSSGNDIKEFIQIAQTPEKMESIMAFLQMLSGYKKPLLAGVEGRAVGVGATMLLHCDMVVASRTAKLQFPFVQLGVVPEAASSHLLPQLVGHQKAFEMLILGDFIEAQDAQDMKMLNHLCEPGEAFQVAQMYAQKVAALPVEAVALSKDLLKYRAQDDVQMALMREGRIFKDRLKSQEAYQAFAAFLSRNK